MDTVFVGNLSFFCTQEHLVNLISPVVPIRSAAIVKTKEGVTCYYGFVYLENEADATKVLEHFNGKKFMGRNMRIGIRSNEAARQVVDGSTVQMFVRFLSEKLEEDVTEETLDNIFSTFGGIADCIVKEYTRFDATPPVQSGYAFLHVHHIDTAHNIMRRLNSENGKEINGISFKVSLSHQCTERLHGGPKGKQQPTTENIEHSENAPLSTTSSPFFRAANGNEDGKYPRHNLGGRVGNPSNSGRQDKRNGGRFGHQPQQGNAFGKNDQFSSRQQGSFSGVRSDQVRSNSRPPQSIPQQGHILPQNVVVNGMPGFYQGMPQMLPNHPSAYITNDGTVMQAIPPMMVDAWQYGANPHLLQNGSFPPPQGLPPGNESFMMLPTNTAAIATPPGMMIYNNSPSLAPSTAGSSPYTAPMGSPGNNQGAQIVPPPYPSSGGMMMPINQLPPQQIQQQILSMQQQQLQPQYHPFQNPSMMPSSASFTTPLSNLNQPMYAPQVSNDNGNMLSKQLQQQYPHHMRIN